MQRFVGVLVSDGCDYQWARQSVPQGWRCLADVSCLLDVSRWQARRYVARSGLGRLLTKRWRWQGRHYCRRVWGVPPGGLELLLFAWAQRDISRVLRDAPRGFHLNPAYVRLAAMANARRPRGDYTGAEPGISRGKRARRP
jgi:hypothetical protein